MPKAKRSNFERKVAKSLTDRGVRYAYEPCQFEYHKKVYKPKCLDCGASGASVVSVRNYTPDFYLPELGWYVEAKGKLTPSERTKLLAVRDANPELDLRLVFMQDNKTTRRGSKRYSDWAEEKGFRYAVGDVPDEWLEESE